LYIAGGIVNDTGSLENHFVVSLNNLKVIYEFNCIREMMTYVHTNTYVFSVSVTALFIVAQNSKQLN
jgi:hypothetical protein